VQELHSLAAMPEGYELLEELGGLRTLLNLMSHENTDIAIAVVDLIQVGH
jgi:beta-catenin-like protein 1